MIELFWIVWAITVGVVASSFLRAWLNPARLLEWEFIFVALFGYVYVYMAFSVATSLRIILFDRDLFLGQFVALLCLVGGIMGWRKSIKPFSALSAPANSQIRSYRGNLPFWIGCLFMLIGLYGSYKTSVHAQQAKGNFNVTASAYIYLIFYLGYSGMMLCLQHLYTRKYSRGSPYWAIFVVAALLFFAPYIIHMRRGPLFAFVVIVLFSYFLLKRRAPRPAVMFGSLFVVGVTMLMLLQVRLQQRDGLSWESIFNFDTFYKALVARNTKVNDNEFLNSIQMTGVVFDVGRYDYGTGYISMPLNAIPRQLWKDKPGIGIGIVDPARAIYPAIQGKYRMTLLGYGAAPGIVADSFFEFGFLCPLFFYGFGYVVGRFYRRFITTRSEAAFICYIGAVACSQWLIVQQFSQCVVPYCFFVVPGALTIILVRKINPGRYLMTSVATRPAARPLRGWLSCMKKSSSLWIECPANDSNESIR